VPFYAFYTFPSGQTGSLVCPRFWVVQAPLVLVSTGAETGTNPGQASQRPGPSLF